jgi:mRNA-degrading endonuclease RelE of RelBE toxin-antitoxin system
MGSGKWTTKIERGAQRQLESLPNPDLAKEAAEIIDNLADDPVPSGAIAMRGYNNMYRLRFGSDAYRIVYRTDSKNRRIIVRAVGSRATVYRGMKR